MGKSDTAASTIEQRKLLCENLSFAASEAYKLLRANLTFAISDAKQTPIIAITSSIRGEAKTTTSINLAYTIAETGKKVLLIDGDMRLPNVARSLVIDKVPGLSDVIAGTNSLRESIKPSGVVENWDILPAGTIPPNPSELLNSQGMVALIKDIRPLYDFIIIDLPPVGIVSDALVLSENIDGYIIIARQDYTSKKLLAQTVSIFTPIKDKLLGFVLTDTSKNKKSYYKKNKYRYYSKQYESYKSYGYGYERGYNKSRKRVGEDKS